jgi:starch-binding outer membrane protein, SusD/RagB family
MKKVIIINTFCLISLAALMPSCKKQIGDLNNPTVEQFLANATKPQLNNLVAGIESGTRNNLGMYLDVVGEIGREMYRFSQADPRYLSDLLGQGSATLNNNTFYLTNPWGSRYRVVKNCNLLIQAATNSTFLTDAEKKGFTGFAKTFKAYQLLLNLNLTYNNGIRIDVNDPNNLGPIVGYDESLAAIAGFLDDGKTDLTGSTIALTLSSGFTGFNDKDGLLKFNRALAARVAVYRKQWANALTALNESFFDLNGNFNTGVYNVFGTGSGDQLNSAFFPQNSGGEVRLVQPKFVTDIAANDDRIQKASLRTASASSGGLTSDRDVWVYKASEAPVPIIRNEELILIYAEAKAQLDGAANLVDATTAINKIRAGHNVALFGAGATKAALLTEMLNQRRYSLFFEGHRWVDMRRYGLLAQLPIDRVGDDVWEQFPLPLTEQ